MTRWLVPPAAMAMLVLGAAAAAAQDNPNAPADGAKAAAPAGTAQQEFDRRLVEWKSLLKELRAVQVRYQNADLGQTGELEKKWAELMAKGEVLLPKLRLAAAAAFREKDTLDLAQFLMKMMEDDLKADRYEEAYEVALPLLEGGKGSRELLCLCGVACFVTNDFENAEKAFSTATKMGQLTEEAARYAAILPDYKKFWEVERKIREKEAELELPRVLMKTTAGDLEIELLENEAPGAVGNFIHLVEKEFYNGLTFHRVINGFMAQGGCPRGDGGGGPGYQIFCECKQPNHRKHFRGSLSMAHAGRDTGGSQFFLTFIPTAHLNGDHTVFGRVVKGMDVLAKLKRRDPMDSKTKPDKIISATVTRKDPNKNYQPNRVP